MLVRLEAPAEDADVFERATEKEKTEKRYREVKGKIKLTSMANSLATKRKGKNPRINRENKNTPTAKENDER